MSQAKLSYIDGIAHESEADYFHKQIWHQRLKESIVTMETVLFMLAVMLVILGIILMMVFYGQKEIDRVEKLRKRGIRVQGTVIGNKRYVGDSIGFNPVIQFKTQQGEFIEVEDKTISQTSQTGFVQGVNVQVSYDKENPRNFLVLTPEEYRRIPTTPWYLQ